MQVAKYIACIWDALSTTFFPAFRFKHFSCFDRSCLFHFKSQLEADVLESWRKEHSCSESDGGVCRGEHKWIVNTTWARTPFAVTLQSWNRKNVTCFEEQIRRRSISVQKTTEQRVVERPKWRRKWFQKILATTFHQGSQAVSLYRFMQFMKHNRGTMVLQKWMTRFQLIGNKSLTRFGGHQSRSNCICCTTSSRTWSSTSWTCRHCRSYSRTRTTCQCTLDRWTGIGSIHATQRRQKNTTEIGISLGWQLVSIDFCKSGRFDARSEKHTHKYHDTSWKNIR